MENAVMVIVLLVRAKIKQNALLAQLKKINIISIIFFFRIVNIF